MADEVIEQSEEDVAEQRGGSLATGTFATSVLNFMIGQSKFLRLHSGAPGVTGSNVASSVAGKAITWGSIVASTTGSASVEGTPIAFTGVPAGTYSHYGIYAADGTTFLYGNALTGAITIPAGSTGTITVTPTHAYDMRV